MDVAGARSGSLRRRARRGACRWRSSATAGSTATGPLRRPGGDRRRGGARAGLAARRRRARRLLPLLGAPAAAAARDRARRLRGLGPAQDDVHADLRSARSSCATGGTSTPPSSRARPTSSTRVPARSAPATSAAAPSSAPGGSTLSSSGSACATTASTTSPAPGADGGERTKRSTARLLEAADFEPLHGRESNILCFRHLPAARARLAPEELDAHQAELRERYNASGRGWITATTLGGRRVLRVTLMNPRTERGAPGRAARRPA